MTLNDPKYPLRNQQSTLNKSSSPLKPPFSRFDQMKQSIQKEKEEKEAEAKRKRRQGEAGRQLQLLEHKTSTGASPRRAVRNSIAVKGEMTDGEAGVVASPLTEQGRGKSFRRYDSSKRPLQAGEVLMWSVPKQVKSLTTFERVVIVPCYKVATSKYLNNFIIFAIVLNTIFLAVDFPGITETHPQLYNGLETGNLILWFVFAIEAFVKILGMGPRLYLSDGFNFFDITIVLVSFVEIVYSDGGGGCRSSAHSASSESLRSWHLVQTSRF